ncbi:hypothetical protein BU14_0332s0027 [Porphyra umbilicalis]|uniref:Uncharacterized protein n=1 Tax=Porphyra umbilicalis TaxID=2786 RepID=A0A1X6NYQ7_PORUM|nr:hypothetical protein BU14_0332s0027 [Porphyra umbilicalis]|eukprot:OSX73675.1 hypothetical protein BU14_0332s0027 [Porphyra umbilicalis]
MLTSETCCWGLDPLPQVALAKVPRARCVKAWWYMNLVCAPDMLGRMIQLGCRVVQALPIPEGMSCGTVEMMEDASMPERKSSPHPTSPLRGHPQCEGAHNTPSTLAANPNTPHPSNLIQRAAPTARPDSQTPPPAASTAAKLRPPPRRRLAPSGQASPAIAVAAAAAAANAAATTARVAVFAHIADAAAIPDFGAAAVRVARTPAAVDAGVVRVGGGVPLRIGPRRRVQASRKGDARAGGSRAGGSRDGGGGGRSGGTASAAGGKRRPPPALGPVDPAAAAGSTAADDAAGAAEADRGVGAVDWGARGGGWPTAAAAPTTAAAARPLGGWGRVAPPTGRRRGGGGAGRGPTAGRKRACRRGHGCRRRCRGRPRWQRWQRPCRQRHWWRRRRRCDLWRWLNGRDRRRRRCAATPPGARGGGPPHPPAAPSHSVHSEVLLPQRRQRPVGRRHGNQVGPPPPQRLGHPLVRRVVEARRLRRDKRRHEAVHERIPRGEQPLDRKDRLVPQPRARPHVFRPLLFVARKRLGPLLRLLHCRRGATGRRGGVVQLCHLDRVVVLLLPRLAEGREEAPRTRNFGHVRVGEFGRGAGQARRGGGARARRRQRRSGGFHLWQQHPCGMVVGHQRPAAAEDTSMGRRRADTVVAAPPLPTAAARRGARHPPARIVAAGGPKVHRFHRLPAPAGVDSAEGRHKRIARLPNGRPVHLVGGGGGEHRRHLAFEDFKGRNTGRQLGVGGTAGAGAALAANGLLERVEHHGGGEGGGGGNGRKEGRCGEGCRCRAKGEERKREGGWG